MPNPFSKNPSIETGNLPAQEISPERKQVPDIELLPSKEKEQAPQENEKHSKKSRLTSSKGKPSKASISKIPTLPAVKSQRLIQIETILEEDLEDIYFSLDQEAREKFRISGEKTAAEIDTLLAKTRIKVKEILKLLVNWLKVIPGVSGFFISQEAKIKANKIMKLK